MNKEAEVRKGTQVRIVTEILPDGSSKTETHYYDAQGKHIGTDYRFKPAPIRIGISDGHV